MVKVVKAFTKEKIGFALNVRANPYAVLQYLPRGVTAGSQAHQSHRRVTAQRAVSIKNIPILGSWEAAGSNIHVKVVATKDGTSEASPQFLIPIAAPLGTRPPGDRGCCQPYW